MSSKQIAAGLARRLATQDVSDATVEKLAVRVESVGFPAIDVDICQFGICVDYWVEREGLADLIGRIWDDRDLGRIRVFPKGIIDPDRFLVTVEHAIPRR